MEHEKEAFTHLDNYSNGGKWVLAWSAVMLVVWLLTIAAILLF